MVETLLGALLGGVLAMLGGFISQHCQNRHHTKVIARALLVELESSFSQEDYESTAQSYFSILDSLIETGDVSNRDILKQSLEVSQEERYPIYFSNAASIGNLPGRTCELVVHFHSMASAIVASGRLLLASDLHPAQVSQWALSLKCRYEVLLKVRQSAILALRMHVYGIPSQVFASSTYRPFALPRK
jgi:hypothetical protein